MAGENDLENLLVLLERCGNMIVIGLPRTIHRYIDLAASLSQFEPQKPDVHQRQYPYGESPSLCTYSWLWYQTAGIRNTWISLH